MRQRQPSFACSLLSGGVAGTTVDVALFPLDTIKTRMQSPAGLRGAGSFRGVYSGLASAANAMKSKMKSRFMRITPSLGSLKSVAAKRSLVERRRHGGHCFALASGCG